MRSIFCFGFPGIKAFKKILIFSAIIFLLSQCSSAPENDNSTAVNLMKAAENMKDSGKGFGPVQSVSLAVSIDSKTADVGEGLFKAKCTTCHRMSADKLIGPGLKGVTMRRKPEWILNMILNPLEMTQKDPAAKELLAKHLSQMTFQDVTQPEALSILEYFRKEDAGGSLN